MLVAVVGASAIAYAALYLAHGFTKMTTVALLGTLASLGFTALLSQVVMGLARISGFTTEESLLLVRLWRVEELLGGWQCCDQGEPVAELV
ncbi:MAG: YibE/F family protein [Acidimicrobiia bacterium]